MLLVDAMEGAVGRELSWDEVFWLQCRGTAAQPQQEAVQSSSKGFCWLLTRGHIPQTPRAEELGCPARQSQVPAGERDFWELEPEGGGQEQS